MRSVPSAPTRPACTSRPSPSRTSVAGLAGAEAARRRPRRRDRRHRQCASAPAQSRDRSCSRARTSKARTTPAGSMARSASSMRSKPPACSMPIPRSKGAVEVAAWCDEEGHFGHFLGRRSYVGQLTEADIDAARDRTSGRTMREALRRRRACRARRACRRAGPAHRISRGAYRAGRHARKRRACRSASSPPSSASGNTASISPASRTTPAPPAWRSARTPAWRWRSSASRSTSAFPALAARARSGPPAASRSIPARRASFRARAEMLFQIRDDDPAVIERLEELLRSMAAEASATGPLHRHRGADPHRRARA